MESLAVDNATRGMSLQIDTHTGSSETLLSRKEAAQRLGLSPRNFAHRIERREIPYVKIGRLYKFIPADIDAYIQAHRIGGTNE